MEIPSPLRVLFLCAEAEPFAKVGGLGDFAGSLPQALQALNLDPTANNASPAALDICLVIPFHGVISRKGYKLTKAACFRVPHTSGPITAEAYATTFNHIPVYLISGAPIAPDVPVYSTDWGFDAHKYTFFSLAALELARELHWQPHILHCNDWHTAAAIYWLSLHRDTDEFFQNIASILSIHNLPYMGVGASFPMESFYLPPSEDHRLPGWARHLPLPLGIITADHITTVSPTYAKEILTPEFGAGLENVLNNRAGAITGILNGLDVQRWDANSDPFLLVNYSSSNINLREANKTALLNEVGFITNQASKADEKIPLLAMVGRIDYQKGVDLLVDALSQMVDEIQSDWRVIILGTGLPELERAARHFEEKYPDKLRVANRFDAPLSHRIYAGADVFLMPSRYEPCGTSQLIAMRYGCVPIARATGGLEDTIVDFKEVDHGTGFLFNEAAPEALLQAIQRALTVYANPPAWRKLQLRGMSQDYSWSRSAQQYKDLYYSLVSTRSFSQPRSVP